MNILLVMADQLSARAVGAYGNDVVRTPNLDALAARGTRFDACYCNNPLCTPSRAAMVTGRLTSRIRAYDNASELPASVPTFMHYLRLGGYRTALSGKMHFVGPDQLHGFEERLITDIYPADFSWTPDWSHGVVVNKGTSVESLEGSGVSEPTSQMAYDDASHARALAYLRQIGQSDDPHFLCVSYSHPHQPYQITDKYWGLYEDSDIDVPSSAEDPTHEYDRWINTHHGLYAFPPREEDVRRSRRAYYGMISYVDDKVSELLALLDELKMADDTLVIFTSDHGDMLGEHGMWFKRTYYDGSARVPFIMAGPGVKEGGAVDAVLSLVDLFPTILDLAGAGHDSAQLDGASFASCLEGGFDGWKDRAVCEYLGEGALAPMRFLRRGRYKYVYVHGHEPLLFDLVGDPDENVNIAGRPETAGVQAELHTELMADWDPEALHADILQSQQERLMLRQALSTGKAREWAFRPDEGDHPGP